MERVYHFERDGNSNEKLFPSERMTKASIKTLRVSACKVELTLFYLWDED